MINPLAEFAYHCTERRDGHVSVQFRRDISTPTLQYFQDIILKIDIYS